MPGLRLLVATFSRTVVGGAEQYVRYVLPAMARRGVEVALLYEYDEQPGAATIDPAGLDVTLFDARRLAGRLLARVADWQPDVAFVQSLTDLELERTLISRFPAALFGHGYYGTCATGTKRHAFPVSRPCHRRFGPACLPLNYLRRCGTLRPDRLIRGYRTERTRSRLLGTYSAVLAASHHMADEFARHGVPLERLHILPMPTTDIVADAEAPRPRATTGRILTMGRLSPEKGGAHLIQATAVAQRMLGRRLRLIVAGTGREAVAWRSLAERVDVDADFVGWVSGADRVALLRSVDLIAVTSLWPEPYGLVGAEAGALGVPAVAYAVGGIPEWLEPGVTGESAPADPPTVPGLADAIVRALRSPDHLHDLGVAAWTRACAKTMDAHLDALIPILDGVSRTEGTREGRGQRG